MVPAALKAISSPSICPQLPVKFANGARIDPLKAMLPRESDVAESKLKITSAFETPLRLIDPPLNEAALPATFTTTVERAGAVIWMVLPEYDELVRLKIFRVELVPVRV